MIEFFVPGKPQALKRHRSTKSGHHYDPSAGDKDDFLAKAMAHRPEEPLLGPLLLEVFCYFDRPKSHYGTGKNAGLLKDSAPVYHTSTPDADNILKFVGDALNGIFWRDDRQIAIARILKTYAATPGIQIDILTLKENHNGTKE